MFKEYYRKKKSAECEETLTERKEDAAEREENLAVAGKESKPKVAMVPLFSWRTIIVVAIGLILGVGLGLGYWIISPSLGSSGQSATDEGGGLGLAGLIGISSVESYESRVRVQVVNPGLDYIPLSNLRQKGEYYTIKANSLPFFSFLSQELAEQASEFPYNDVNEVAKIVRTEFEYDSEPPAIKMTVVGSTAQEAVFLAELVPQAFNDYLLDEEERKQEKQYERTLEEIQTVKASLVIAQQELDALGPTEVFDNPSYISLSARVDALQRELDAQSGQLATQYVEEADIQDKYDKTLQQMAIVSTKLAEAEQELQALWKKETNSTTVDDTTSIILEAKIRGLQGELDALMIGDAEQVGLAQLIAKGTTKGTEYDNLLKNITITSEALAKAKKELKDLQSQSEQTQQTMSLDYRIAQIKVDTLNIQMSTLRDNISRLYSQILSPDEGDAQSNAQSAYDRISTALIEAKKELAILESELGYDRLSADLDYQIARDKVNNLNDRLGRLTEQLGTLVGDNADSWEITDYLVAGKPSMPLPVLPQRARARNTLMMGAVVGAAGAWILLNFKWITKGMPPSSPATTQKEEDEEEEVA